jgi:hypothetical protein
MKKKINQNFKYQKSRQRYQLKRAKWSKGSLKRKPGINKYLGPLKFIEHKAPNKLNLNPENANKTIKYINEVKKIGSKRNGVDFDLKDVTDIGVGAISMLLSVMAELRSKGIRFKGTKPSNIDVKNVLEKSGFMKFVKGTVNKSNRNTKNRIFTGNKRTHHTEILDVIHDAMETVWGVKGRNQLLYGTIVEMIKNSSKHAFKVDKDVRWHFAVSHDQINNSVKFSFVDNGMGVVKSHEKDDFFKKAEGIFRDNADFIEGAYTEGIKSKTGLSWRGTGLPFIFETFNDSIVRNFVVITNEAYVNFETNDKKSLSNSFSGTYYYFEVDTSCLKQCFPIEYDRN